MSEKKPSFPEYSIHVGKGDFIAPAFDLPSGTIYLLKIEDGYIAISGMFAAIVSGDKEYSGIGDIEGNIQWEMFDPLDVPVIPKSFTQPVRDDGNLIRDKNDQLNFGL